MKFLRILFFSGITIFSLFLGFRAGLITSSNSELGLASSDARAEGKSLFASKGAVGQVNLLLITMNDAQTPESLISVWMLGYHHNQPNLLTFVPLYPGAGQGVEDKDSLLVRQFQVDRRGQISAKFLESLANIYRISWDGIVTLSAREVVHAIDSLGGINLEGKNVNGKDLLDSLNEPGPEAQTALPYQGEAIKAVCGQIADWITSTQLEDFATLLSAKLSASLRDPEINSEALKENFLNPRLRCETPTLP
jgi:hypothetical protein